MNETADYIDELPAMAIDIKGSTCPGSGGPDGAVACGTCAANDSACRNNCRLSPPGSNPPCYYLTAGIRNIAIGTTDNCEKERRWQKYALIYTAQNMQGLTSGGSNWDEKDPNWNTLSSIKVIDSCEGEILDYSGCKRQCNTITDKNFCVKECQLESGTNCSQLCSPDIEIPWYCGSELDNLFSVAANNLKSMGVQQDYTDTHIKNNTLRKQEATTGITTTDTLSQNYSNIRMIVFRHYGTSTVTETPITNTENRNEKQTQETPW